MSQMVTSNNITPDLGTKRKRKKVSLACVFCRRSHMTCDEGRPCQRCIKRSIGHMCHDEPRADTGKKVQRRSPSLAESDVKSRDSLTFPNVSDELTIINDFIDDMDESRDKSF
ncbi:hypothetical protein VTP01DRAFT_10843 [Rhizomucor pusillus]|uniref:uncharacterized protein n=1 Tax=Rhizomucor pusillus TaxID=4840 RepID=UPI003741FF64